MGVFGLQIHGRFFRKRKEIFFYLYIYLFSVKGRAIAQVVSRWLSTAAARVRARVWQVGFVVDKVALGQVSPANLHSTKFSIITITRGRYNRPFTRRRAKWTQFHPPLCEKFDFLLIWQSNI
jgi:hypothetical protein